MTLERRRRALEADPGSTPRRLALVAALLGAGEAREALTLLDEESEDLDERTLLAEALRRLDRTRRAERLLGDVLAANPLHTGALRQLAEIRIDRGSPAEALELLERLRKIAPNDGAACALLGRAERRLGFLERARSTLEGAMAIDPYQGTIYVELARLWESLSEWELANEAWEVAAELAASPADEISRHLAESARKSAEAPGRPLR